MRKAADASSSCSIASSKSATDEPPAENAGLVNLLSDWGVTVNKDLVLDLSGVGELLRLRPGSAR